MIKYTLAAATFVALTGCNNSSSIALTDSSLNSDAAPSVEETANPASLLTNCNSSAQLGHAFSAASGDQSDPLFTPAAAVDGCADTASSWSGNQAESLILDAGAVQNIQGLYLWMSFDRAEWLSVEQSIDGENWQQSWRRVQNISSAESTYFSLTPNSPSRFVRITGYGSEKNAWTNIAEARWSLSGETITTERVWRHSDNLVALHSGVERAASPHYQRPLSSMFISCPYVGDPVYVDATSRLDSFWRVDTVGGVLVYSFDWDHYPRSEEPDFFGAPLLTYKPMRHAQALLEPLAAEDPLLLVPSDCATTVVQDSLHIVDEMLSQADAGFLSTDAWH